MQNFCGSVEVYDSLIIFWWNTEMITVSLNSALFHRFCRGSRNCSDYYAIIPINYLNLHLSVFWFLFLCEKICNKKAIKNELTFIALIIQQILYFVLSFYTSLESSNLLSISRWKQFHHGDLYFLLKMIQWLLRGFHSLKHSKICWYKDRLKGIMNKSFEVTIDVEKSNTI